MTKYVSLEHAIRNAVRDQQYKKPLNEDKEWEKDSAAVKASTDKKFVSKMIDKWGERGGAWLNHPAITGADKKKPVNEDFEFEMARNELRTAIDAAKRLMAHLDGDGELEAWVQSKITKGADYLDTVADYMDHRDTKKLKEHTENVVEIINIIREQTAVMPTSTGASVAGEAIKGIAKRVLPRALAVGATVAPEVVLPLAAAAVGAKAIHNYVTDPENVKKATDERAGEAQAGAEWDKKLAARSATAAAMKRQAIDDADAAAASKSRFAPPAEKPVTKPKHDEPVPGTPSQPEKVDVPVHEPYKPDTSPPKEMPKPANDPVKVPSEPVKPAEKPAEPAKPAAPSVPAPAIPKPVAPAAPVPAPVKPAPATPAPTPTAPAIPAPAPAPTKPLPAPAPVTAPAKAPATSPAPAITMPDKKTDTAVSPKVATAVDTKTDTKTAVKTGVKEPVKPSGIPFKFSLPSFDNTTNPHSEYNVVPVSTSVSRAKLHRTFKEENGPDNTRRKDSSTELVGRPDSAGVKDSKSVLARNGSIKTKISEEKKLAGIVKDVVKKKKEQKEGGPNPMVDFEPKLNHKYDNEN